ncbi:TonB-dependent siderophore receptor [Sphingosinicella sp. CPCC 101087]|uniref:TonB-dependent receptor plug domain-containing protein n=1 Tax=Sphingosinicella sp. CPCC 101087 TaxID=2497754 RepID=UPI00101B812D|nr:TonB-dependent receptor [Sphingosinicella sp. CPCC 101087]
MIDKLRFCLPAGSSLLALMLVAPAPADAQSEGAGPDDPLGEEIVVTAGRREQPIEQQGAAISVFTAEMIERQQLTTVDEVLQRVPGVAITRSGGIGQNTQVRMRGFTTKHVLVMIDGIRLNNPSEADNQYGLEHLFLDGVERVEVLRGPQSGLYGGDASAGVINIITRRPQGDPYLRISGMYGSHDSAQLTASSAGRLSDVGYSLGATYYRTDGISLASRPPGNVERDGYENLTLSGRVEWDVTETLRVEGWLQYIDSTNEVDNGFLPADNPDGLPAFLFQDSPGEVQTEQLFGVVRANLETLDGRLTHTAQLSYVDASSLSLAPESRQESDGQTTEAAYYATYDLGAGAYLLGGIERKREEGRFEQPTGGGFATVNDSISETGLFATAHLRLFQGAYLSGAIRHDDNELFGGNTTWRASGAYNLPGAWLPGIGVKLRSSYGTGAEAPGLRQLLGSSPTFQGNPDLQPESSWMWDAGVDLRLASNLASLSLTYYRGKATDGIFNITDPATGISSPQNVDSPVRMRGIEVEMAVRPARWIDFTFNYTNMSVRLVSSSTQLFGRPRNEGSAAVTIRPTERFSVTADAYWRGRFFSDYPTSYRMPGYGLLNVSASWELTERVRLDASVRNLFDKFYEEKLGDSTYGRTALLRLTTTF